MKRRSRLRVAKKSVRVYGDQDHPNFGSVITASALYFAAGTHPDKNVRRRAKRALNKLLQKP